MSIENITVNKLRLKEAQDIFCNKWKMGCDYHCEFSPSCWYVDQHLRILIENGLIDISNLSNEEEIEIKKILERTKI